MFRTFKTNVTCFRSRTGEKGFAQRPDLGPRSFCRSPVDIVSFFHDKWWLFIFGKKSTGMMVLCSFSLKTNIDQLICEFWSHAFVSWAKSTYFKCFSWSSEFCSSFLGHVFLKIGLAAAKAGLIKHQLAWAKHSIDIAVRYSDSTVARVGWYFIPGVPKSPLTTLHKNLGYDHTTLPAIINQKMFCSHCLFFFGVGFT